MREAPNDPPGYPDNPVVLEVHRADGLESVHRGAWCLVNASGDVIEERGDVRHPVFTRSAAKCMQALPLFETGAAERFGFTTREIALAVASHSAEEDHVGVARGLLGRLGLGEDDLGCGPQPPMDAEARLALRERGADPGRIHNNCSGKHAAFLALAKHLGQDTADYLDPAGESQSLVRGAVAEMKGVSPASLGSAVDGCSAPTFRSSLAALGTGYARLTSPDGLAPERRAAAERIVGAVRAHPELIAGRRKRLCTAIARASRGALFPKIGAEAVYAVGVPGRDLALAVKVDDGGQRGLGPVVVALLERFGLIDADGARALEPFAMAEVRNWDGAVVGHTRVP